LVRSKGLRILGFPCNQFGAQEPGDDSEIKSFCSVKYGVDFPLFSKIEVNGPNTHNVYKFLRANSSLNQNGVIGLIKWNFYMFLLNGEGKVLKLIEAKAKPEDIEKDIASLCK
jgi:glutathione peroxidase